MAVTLIDTVVSDRYPRVYEYRVTGDAADQTVHSPESGNRVWVCGLVMTETSAIDLQFKTATKSITLELGPHQAIVKDLGNGVMFFGKEGEALQLNTSADLTELTIWVTESPSFLGWFA